MRAARAKAKQRKQKFSTYVSSLVAYDVEHGGTGNADDAMLTAADGVIWLRIHRPDVFAEIVKPGATIQSLLTGPLTFTADELVKVSRAMLLLQPARDLVNDFHGLNETTSGLYPTRPAQPKKRTTERSPGPAAPLPPPGTKPGSTPHATSA